MEKVVYLNGSFVEKSKAKVSVFDHGFLYGDGVFEGIRVYEGNIFKLMSHLKRLYASAKAINLKINLNIEQMKKAVVQTVRKNNLSNAYIRLLVSRGVGDLGLNPLKCPESMVIIIADEINLYPEEFYSRGLSIITSSVRRNIPDALNPRIKSLNYLNNILAKIDANNAGVPEALMLNNQGYVAECTGDNIFIVDEKETILTPPVSVGVLTGITRDTIMDIARSMGYNVEKKLFTTFEVYNARECFLTGTAAEVIPVVNIDKREIGNGLPGKITKKLLGKFKEVVKKEGTKI
ncbi:MAG: branched-chain-amino-acid transaminase [Elusimicrobiota bacterium]